MKLFVVVIKKELTSVMRDSTIIISILIQLFIASFSSALLLGMLSLYDADTILQTGGADIKVGIVSASDTILPELLAKQGIMVISYSTFDDAQTAFFQGKVNAFFVIPANIQNTAEIKLYVPNSDAFSSLIRMVIQEPLKQYENSLRVKNNVEVRYADLKGKPATAFDFLYSVLIPLLMFFPASVAGSMVVDSLTEETENNTLQTLLSAPISLNGVIGAKISAALILVTGQCIAWMILLRLNHVAVQNKLLILALAIIVAGIISISSALGTVLLKDRERSQFVYSLGLMAAIAISSWLGVSPIQAVSRLAVGDYYASGWLVVEFGAFMAILGWILLKTSRRMVI